MGIKNYLIKGISGTGKTSVCHELRRRGHHALNGDRDLVMRLHATKEDIPKNGILIDATAPLERVVDKILEKS
ncbi:MAG: hypothetical protein OXT65_04670 [Alphaproteobacteria bacterium]|nr:hypothetical protein [Alphaproteobacteria bacterium]